MNRILCFLFAVGVFASAASADVISDLETGRQIYMDNCARCHGVTGAGDGRDAARMFPRPRKLSEGVYKFRTTASGTPPTDEDLFHTVSEGLPGSRMPEFQRLSEESRRQVIQYIQSLSPIFEEQKPEPIHLGKDPGPTKANLAHGKELYTQLGCNACHGAVGRADGPSAPTLVDQWGVPIRPADLTQGWSYRSGSSQKDILTRLMTGLDGTPMPSYAEATTPADAWDLAYYVHSLQEKPNWGKTDLRLSGSYYQQGEFFPTTVSAASFQAAPADGKLAFQLSWHDPTQSNTRETPPDAVALVFLPDRRSKLTFGSLRSWPPSPDAPPVDVLYWSADRETATFARVKNLEELAGGAGERIPAQASFADGKWTLAVARPLPADQKSLRFGMMVWDGGNQEQGRRRSNSSWVDLEIQR